MSRVQLTSTSEDVTAAILLTLLFPLLIPQNPPHLVSLLGVHQPPRAPAVARRTPPRGWGRCPRVEPARPRSTFPVDGGTACGAGGRSSPGRRSARYPTLATTGRAARRGPGGCPWCSGRLCWRLRAIWPSREDMAVFLEHRPGIVPCEMRCSAAFVVLSIPFPMDSRVSVVSQYLCMYSRNGT